jgi:hypothetical protein
VRRPLHNGKKNFWWGKAGNSWWGDCNGREIELRRLTIDPQLGFFVSEQEALDCLDVLTRGSSGIFQADFV